MLTKTPKVNPKPLAVFALNYKAGMAAHRGGDWATALKHFRLLAEQGNENAQHAIGVMYEHGRGVFHDYAEAIKWYGKAAEQGNARSQYNLGWIHYEGKGISQNYAKAVKWWRKDR